MRCYFNIYDEEDEKNAVKFFKSIGMEYVLKNKSSYIDVEFINTPDVLKTYSLRESFLGICNISPLGITFSLVATNTTKGEGKLIVEGEGKLIVENENNEIGGVVFCPMSNIKIINCFGKLRYEKDKKS